MRWPLPRLPGEVDLDAVSSTVLACSVCFGESSQAGPLRWAIAFLLLLVVALQICFAVYLKRLLERDSEESGQAVPANGTEADTGGASAWREETASG